MDQLAGLLLPSERKGFLSPAAPGIIRHRSRPPALVAPSEVISEAGYNVTRYGAYLQAAKSGTPQLNIDIDPAAYLPIERNPFPNIRRVFSAYAASVTSGGSTSAERIQGAVQFPPNTGITAYDVGLTSHNARSTSDGQFYVGFRKSISYDSVGLMDFSVKRPEISTPYGKVAEVRPGRLPADGIPPAFYFFVAGSSSGNSEFLMIHFFRFYFD